MVKAFKDPFWMVGVILRKVSPLIKNDERYLRIEYFLGREAAMAEVALQERRVY